MQPRNDVFSVASLMRLVVLPAVEEILAADELDALSIDTAAPDTVGLKPVPDRYWLQVIARGEPFHLSLDAEPLRNVGWVGMREHVADQLRSFVAESRFGWGQRR